MDNLIPLFISDLKNFQFVTELNFFYFLNNFNFLYTGLYSKFRNNGYNVCIINPYNNYIAFIISFNFQNKNNH